MFCTPLLRAVLRCLSQLCALGMFCTPAAQLLLVGLVTKSELHPDNPSNKCPFSPLMDPYHPLFSSSQSPRHCHLQCHTHHQLSLQVSFIGQHQIAIPHPQFLYSSIALHQIMAILHLFKPLSFVDTPWACPKTVFSVPYQSIAGDWQEHVPQECRPRVTRVSQSVPQCPQVSYKSRTQERLVFCK